MFHAIDERRGLSPPDEAVKARREAAMTTPKWNNDWDQSDPLHGKRGWSRRHYFAVSVSAMLLLTMCRLVFPAISKLRFEKEHMERINEMRRGAFEEMTNDSLKH